MQALMQISMMRVCLGGLAFIASASASQATFGQQIEHFGPWTVSCADSQTCDVFDLQTDHGWKVAKIEVSYSSKEARAVGVAFMGWQRWAVAGRPYGKFTWTAKVDGIDVSEAKSMHAGYVLEFPDTPGNDDGSHFESVLISEKSHSLLSKMFSGRDIEISEPGVYSTNFDLNGFSAAVSWVRSRLNTTAQP